MSATVTRDQFAVNEEGITHVPTGATFIPHIGSLNSGSMYLGQLGNVLKNGEDYGLVEVQAMMQQIWLDTSQRTRTKTDFATGNVAEMSVATDTSHREGR